MPKEDKKDPNRTVDTGKFRIGDRVRISPILDIQNAGQVGTIIGYNFEAWPYCWAVEFKNSLRPHSYADCEMVNAK